MEFRIFDRRRQRRPGIRKDTGFSYVGLLILLAIMAIVSAAGLQLGKAMHRRAAEEALLDVGLEFGQALESYRLATPAGQPDAPLELKELLRDPRFPGTKRHLRKLFDDPLTGQQEWGILRAEDSKRIEGVYSLSDAKPIKIGNFDLRFQGFEGKSSYQQWVFTHLQTSTAGLMGGHGGSANSPTLINPQQLMDIQEDAPATQASPPNTASGLVSPSDLH